MIPEVVGSIPIIHPITLYHSVSYLPKKPLYLRRFFVLRIAISSRRVPLYPTQSVGHPDYKIKVRPTKPPRIYSRSPKVSDKAYCLRRRALSETFGGRLYQFKFRRRVGVCKDLGRMGQKRSCFRQPCLYRTKKELLIIR